MEQGRLNNGIEMYSRDFDILSTCTDDYLFIYDLTIDNMVISERATETFLLREAQFS